MTQSNQTFVNPSLEQTAELVQSHRLSAAAVECHDGKRRVMLFMSFAGATIGLPLDDWKIVQGVIDGLRESATCAFGRMPSEG